MRPAPRPRPARLAAALAALAAACGGGAAGGGASAERTAVPAPAPDAALPDDVRAALDEARAAVEAAPADAAAWLELAMRYEANGLPPLAEPCYARAAQLDPGDALAPYHLARLLGDRGAYPAALDAVRRASALAPRYGPAHWRAGEWLLLSGRLDEAAAACARAAEVDPQNPAGRWGMARVALERGDARAALEALAPLADGGRALAYTHHLRATALRRLGQLERAAAEAARGGEPVWLDPWKADVESRRGGFHGALARVRAAVQAGDLDGAQRMLEEMHAREPDSVNVVGMLSDVYLANGRAPQAEALLLAARALLPDHYRVAFNLSLVYERTGDDARALAELDECLRLHPTLGLAHLRRARVLSRRGDHPGALAALEEARRVGEQGPELWRLFGVSYAHQARWPQAAESFDRALRLQPAAPVALMAAEAHARAGGRAAAWGALEQAGRLGAEEQRLAAVRELLVATVGPPEGSSR